MRKRYIEMKKKFTTNTYMKEAVKYDTVVTNEDDYYITIKRYRKMNGKFALNINGKEKVYIDEGYFVVEITPLYENYNIRFYFNDKKEYIDYYIDITLKNGVEYKIPYYVDLYLDIVHDNNGDKNFFSDEDELLDALNKKMISKKDYELAYRVGNKLLKSLKDNKYFNINALDYINRFF